MFLLLLLVLCHAIADNMCQFKFGAFSHVDLTPIPQLKVDLSKCGEKYHSFILDLCQNLDDSVCPSTESRGPGNGCDMFESTTSAYYWIGEANNMTNTEYDKKEAEFTVKYTGVLQVLHSPEWIRSIEVLLKCDSHAKEPQIDCIGIEQQEASTMYKLMVTSKDVCPHWF